MGMAPNAALVGAESVTGTVSSFSSAVSFTTLRVMFWLVTPGAKVSVPSASVKSTPAPVAVPPVTE